MDTAEAHYAKYEGLVVLKLGGHLRCWASTDSPSISAGLEAFMAHLFETRDFDNVLIDLTDLAGIDSTNLGLIARITRYTQQSFGRKATIVSTNDDINTILESVGFDQVFIIVRDPQNPEVELKALAGLDGTEKDMAQLILNAHRELLALNERNKAMFSDVVDLLEEELERRGSGNTSNA